MLPPLEIREAQATELLRVCCQSTTRAHLLAYARKLAGSEADELLQQALLDAHDAVQARGTSCEAPDYRFFVMTIMKRRLVDEQRRRGKFVALPDEAADWQHPVPADERAHLGQQVAAYVSETAEPQDRLALRLSADGYSTRQIEQLTGRPNRTVARALASLKEAVRGAFGQSLEGI